MATVRKQAGRALLVAWGMRAFWARQKVYVLTHLGVRTFFRTA